MCLKLTSRLHIPTSWIAILKGCLGLFAYFDASDRNLKGMPGAVCIFQRSGSQFLTDAFGRLHILTFWVAISNGCLEPFAYVDVAGRHFGWVPGHDHEVTSLALCRLS